MKALACIALLAFTGFVSAQTGQVDIFIQANGKPVPCRIHLTDAAGKPFRAPKLPFWRDHFVCPGSAKLTLAAGSWKMEVERGPEWRRISTSFKVKDGGKQVVKVSLKRLIDLRAEGWWSGDLHVHRAVADVPLLMRAEDIHVAPVITWWNNRNLWTKQQLPANPLKQVDGNRYFDVLAGEDEREGGALLYFHLKKPLAITGSSREYPSPMKFVRAARQHEGVWIDIEKPFWWDVPVWLASGQANSVGLANNHMCRSRMYESEAWGKPRIKERLPAPLGNGYWTQEIYYHIQNAGIRLPPSAGSASGVLPNPVGYNRVYVHIGAKMDYRKWWAGLKAGRSFVTNGPLLRVEADSKLPGHVFASSKAMKISLNAKLTTQDPISTFQIIKDGQVERTVPVKEGSVSLGTVEFKKSGWFLVRVIANNKKTFRFASTAPYYVEVGTNRRHISKASARFFLEWVRERTRQIKLADTKQRAEVMKEHQAAEKFWQKRLNEANAP